MAADDRAAWIERVLDITVPRVADAPADPAAALRNWQAARETVIGQLRALSRAITAANDPEGDAAIILVEAIAKNLTAAPGDPRQVKELERYLRTDDIIDEAESPNGFGVKVMIRAPLLPPLLALKSALVV